ncbi:hypothetical protein K443DRAFT_367950 [Laccaria amethystina LaAM-08-1]|uniref:Uncharacterized protein n=1 Tax=Laccaria amethystina LaAM-08-1 TaxID=1095629 RepID=A0A0C9YAW8_9AGAR|nr:hypothetical protein K443DRAFT_367950 [Laccaria amethystina LaAM-08-1]
MLDAFFKCNGTLAYVEYMRSLKKTRPQIDSSKRMSIQLQHYSPRARRSTTGLNAQDRDHQHNDLASPITLLPSYSYRNN